MGPAPCWPWSDQISLDQRRTPITPSILESLWVKLEALVCDDIFGFHSDTPMYKDMLKKHQTNKKKFSLTKLDLKRNLIAI